MLRSLLSVVPAHVWWSLVDLLTLAAVVGVWLSLRAHRERQKPEPRTPVTPLRRRANDRDPAA